MGKTFKSVISYLYFPICILLYPLLIKNSLAMADFRQWQEHFKIKELGTFRAFCYLFAYYPKYRSVFYFRQNRLCEYTVGLLSKPLVTLCISRGCVIEGGDYRAWLQCCDYCQENRKEFLLSSELYGRI